MSGSRVGMGRRTGDPHFAAKTQEEGYRLLYISIVESALADLAEPAVREAAIAWVRGEPARISRDDVCLWIGIPPERIVRAAARRLEDFNGLPPEGLFG